MLSLLAAAGLLVGFLLLGSLSANGPEAVATTTSTTTTTTEPIAPPLDLENFTVSQISRGDQFEWEQSFVAEDAFPVALFENEGWVYLFASESVPWFEQDKGGLRGWRTSDGAAWQALGQVITEPQLITHVTPTRQGLVAVGRDLTNREPRVWLSEDGIDWAVEDLPVQDLDAFTSVYPTAVAGSDTQLVVAGQTQVDIYDILQERIGSSLEFDSGRYGWDIEVVGDGVQMIFYGPLGFPLGVITAEDLDLTEEEADALLSSYRGGSWASFVWTKSGDAGWVQSEVLDAFSVESLNVMRDNRIVAYGYGSTSSTSRTTRDGVTWESTGSGGPSRVTHWDDRLIGASDSGRPSLLASEDDDSWTDIGPGQLFPYELAWTIEGFGAGPGGIAATIRGWDQSGSFEQPEPVGPVTLTSNGTTLALDFDLGYYTLSTTDGTTHRWSIAGPTAPDGVVPDLETGDISFHDPETGAFLASFAIDDLFDAQEEYWSRSSGGGTPDPLTAFAFTADGTDWSIQDTGEAWGDIWVSHLEVTESRVMAAGVVGALFIDPSGPPSLAVWTAAIP